MLGGRGTGAAQDRATTTLPQSGRIRAEQRSRAHRGSAPT